MSLPSLLLTLACSSPPAPEAPAPVPENSAPTPGDTLVVAAPFDPGNLNPLVAPYALSGFYIDSTQLGLVQRAVDDNGLTYRPGLAESWTWADDGKALSYTLREGLVWNDGVPITTADVAFTYELIGDPAVASNWLDDSKHIARIEVHDERRMTFHFTEAGSPVLLQGYTFRGVVPKHILADADRGTLRGHAYSRSPSASGPWMVTEWSAEEKLVLSPNPAVTARATPYLDRIVTRIIPEYATRLIELESGTVDYLFSVEKADIPALRTDYPHINLIKQPADSMSYLGWNMKDPVFSDLRVRQAMTHAIDGGKIIDDLYTVDGEKYAQPCLGTVGPNLGDWYASDIVPLGHDPARAAALLDEAGWTDTDGDGIRDKDGEALKISLNIQNGIPSLKRLGIHMQAQLKSVGVALELSAMEPNLFARMAREHEFQAMLWSFGNNPKVDPTIQWHSTGQYNWMQYSDPETDRLIEEAKTTTDPAQAAANIREVQRRVYQAQPATFLFWEDSVSAIHSRFQDVTVHTFNGLDQAELWWVPTDQQKYR